MRAQRQADSSWPGANGARRERALATLAGRRRASQWQLIWPGRMPAPRDAAPRRLGAASLGAGAHTRQLAANDNPSSQFIRLGLSVRAPVCLPAARDEYFYFDSTIPLYSAARICIAPRRLPSSINMTKARAAFMNRPMGNRRKNERCQLKMGHHNWANLANARASDSTGAVQNLSYTYYFAFTHTQTLEHIAAPLCAPLYLAPLSRAAYARATGSELDPLERRTFVLAAQFSYCQRKLGARPNLHGDGRWLENFRKTLGTVAGRRPRPLTFGGRTRPPANVLIWAWAR